MFLQIHSGSPSFFDQKEALFKNVGKTLTKSKGSYVLFNQNKNISYNKKYTRDCIRKVPNKKDKIKYCMKYILCNNSLMILNFCSLNHFNLEN